MQPPAATLDDADDPARRARQHADDLALPALVLPAQARQHPVARRRRRAARGGGQPDLDGGVRAVAGRARERLAVGIERR